MLEKLLKDLQVDEGWSAKPYHDTEGFLTIGFGFLIDPRRSVSLPKPVGLFWLEYLAEQRWEHVRAALPWVDDQPEDVQRALGNMSYQLGVAGLLKFRNMLDHLKAGERAKAASEALASKWAKQTPKRAARVAKLILGDGK